MVLILYNNKKAGLLGQAVKTQWFIREKKKNQERSSLSLIDDQTNYDNRSQRQIHSDLMQNITILKMKTWEGSIIQIYSVIVLS